MIKHVRHCEQGMRVNSTQLSQGTQLIYTCEICGHQELEVYSSSGRPRRWVNLSVKRQMGEVVDFVSP